MAERVATPVFKAREGRRRTPKMTLKSVAREVAVAVVARAGMAVVARGAIASAYIVVVKGSLHCPVSAFWVSARADPLAAQREILASKAIPSR